MMMIVKTMRDRIVWCFGADERDVIGGRWWNQTVEGLDFYVTNLDLMKEKQVDSIKDL